MPDVTRLRLKVVAKASRNRIAGWMGEEFLKVQVTAAPEHGKANAAVIKLLVAALGVAREQVRLIAGESKEHKMVAVRGLSEIELRARLALAARKTDVNR